MNGGVTYVNECVLYYRQHGTNVTKNEKWKFWVKIKNAAKKKNSHFIKEQVEILQALLHKDLNLSHQKEVKESIEFYKSLGNFKRFKFLFWYWRNFYKMNCCSDKKLKISCFIKNIILGI